MPIAKDVKYTKIGHRISRRVKNGRDSFILKDIFNKHRLQQDYLLYRIIP